MSLFSFVSVGVFARRAIPRTLEMNISLPAFSTLGENILLSVFRKIDDQIHFGFCFLSLETVLRRQAFRLRQAYGGQVRLAWFAFYSGFDVRRSAFNVFFL